MFAFICLVSAGASVEEITAAALVLFIIAVIAKALFGDH